MAARRPAEMRTEQLRMVQCGDDVALRSRWRISVAVVVLVCRCGLLDVATRVFLVGGHFRAGCTGLEDIPRMSPIVGSPLADGAALQADLTQSPGAANHRRPDTHVFAGHSCQLVTAQPRRAWRDIR